MTTAHWVPAEEAAAPTTSIDAAAVQRKAAGDRSARTAGTLMGDLSGRGRPGAGAGSFMGSTLARRTARRGAAGIPLKHRFHTAKASPATLPLRGKACKGKPSRRGIFQWRAARRRRFAFQEGLGPGFWEIRERGIVPGARANEVRDATTNARWRRCPQVVASISRRTPPRASSSGLVRFWKGAGICVREGCRR